MNLKFNWSAGFLCLLLACATHGFAQTGASAPRADKLSGEQESSQQSAVKGVVNRLFETMEAKQMDALRELFIPEGRFVSTFVRQGQPTVRLLSLEDFIKLVVEAKEPFRERMFDMEVRVEGDVATVWGRYDFHVGARLTNCGYNSFQLVRTKEGWKIIHVASSIITQGCQETK